MNLAAVYQQGRSWTRVALGDILTFFNGRAYKQNELLEVGTPVIRIQNLNGGDKWYYSNLNLPDEKYCQDGDLLFAWSATFGPYFWSGEKAIYHYHIWKVIPSSRIQKRFAYYLLQYITERLKASGRGISMIHITKAGMEAWEVELPPLEEQQRIAAILDKVYALRSKRKRSLELSEIGRGTRLCADLFGPGQDKEFFRVFDYCQNIEFFGANPELKEASAARSLSERLFAGRVDLVRALDDKHVKAGGFAAGEQTPYRSGGDVPPSEPDIRASAAKTLQDIVGGMNEDNFIVRQHRRSVEKFREPNAWEKIDDEKRKELVDEVAPLPSSHMLGTEDAKRFDLLMFQLELALLKGSKRFDTLRKQLLEIASALEEQTAIPAIAQHAELIEDIQTDQWWEGVTVPLLELVRLRLRDLVQHIEKGKKALVYSNFADEIGEGIELQLPQVGEADFARFKTKARHFLRAHQHNIVLHKLRQGKPLTPSDLSELEKLLLDAGVGEAGDIERAREVSHGFGRFVRSLVGLDRAAVSEAFGGFIAAGTATAAQIEFINMVIEHLTDQGMMDPSLLYEPPFTAIAPTGPEHLFDEAKVVRLVSTIREINDSAVA